eukprot:2380363-Karenia_brevis.AAC.1
MLAICAARAFPAASNLLPTSGLSMDYAAVYANTWVTLLCAPSATLNSSHEHALSSTCLRSECGPSSV